MKRLLLVLFSWLLIIHAFPQSRLSQTQIKIYGEIVDQNNNAISNCNIKIQVRGKTIKYFSLQNDNKFNLTLEIHQFDTLKLTISHISFNDTTLLLPFKESGSYPILVKLSYKQTILNSVIVTNNIPIWERGDTTFFKVDNFKETTDTKLKDIIAKMPGFKLDDFGTLTYNGVIVSKILIDGEDILSSKTKLLLNNFPTHILETIQALQNQAERSIFQGLTSDAGVVVNLGLKKDHASALFGSSDFGIGAGSNIMYNFNPTLFTLKNKIKLAFIGNYNSLGTGIGWQQDNDLRNSWESTFNRLQLRNNPLLLIYGLEAGRYLTNNQYDNNLQINTNLNSKTTLKVQANYFLDKQSETNVTNSILLNDSLSIKREDTNVNHNRPNILSLTAEVRFRIDTTKEISFSTKHYDNWSESFSNSVNNINGKRSFFSNETKNAWFSNTFSTLFAYRISKHSGLEFKAELNFEKNNQIGNSNSDYWGSLLVSNNKFDTYKIRFDNALSGNSAGARYFFRKHSKLTEISLQWESVSANLNNENYLINRQLPLPDTSFLSSPIGTYSQSTLKAKLFRDIVNTEPFSLNLNLTIGMQQMKTIESSQQLSKSSPYYYIFVNASNKISRKASSYTTLVFEQKQLQLYQFHQNIYPVDFTYFHNFQNTLNAPSKLIFGENLHWIWFRSLSNGVLTFQYAYNFASFAINNIVKDFAQISTDSIIHNTTTDLSLGFSNEIPVIFLNGIVTADLQFNKSSYYLISNDQLSKTIVAKSIFKLSYKRNWNKKLFIIAQSAAELSKFEYPPALSAKFISSYLNISTSLKNRIILTERLVSELIFTMRNANIGSPEKVNYNFVDLNFNYRIAKKSLNLIFKAENLTNTKVYSTTYNTAASQFFSYVTFRNRSFFIGLHCDL